jgi:hypothetical protein
LGRGLNDSDAIVLIGNTAELINLSDVVISVVDQASLLLALVFEHFKGSVQRAVPTSGELSFAQPPANGWQPFGLQGGFHARIAGLSRQRPTA